MIHVSILVPHGSVLLNSIVGLFKVFDLANHHSERGGKGAAFEVHLVGSASTAELYGGHGVVKPDLTLEEVVATDLAIVPAMAGNIGEATKKNYAFIPWIQKQYRSGSDIAGLCTGVFFIADAGLIREKHCSSHWFVDATFRKQYSHINSLAEKSTVAQESIHSERGAWFFLQELLERVVGKQAALACSKAFEEPFNQECQSVVSISHQRRHAEKRAPVDGNPMQAMTAERFISLFELNHGVREGKLSIATLFEETLQTPVGNTNPKASCALSEYKQQGRADHHNGRAMKALLKKIDRPETGYRNGKA
jgi:transcriptional regulator GlxA family with amidase domain